MATRSRRSAAPFEVMQPGKGADPTDRGGEAAGEPRAPVLRVPGGYAILVGIACIGLIVLAYATGHQRGRQAAIQIQDETARLFDMAASQTTSGAGPSAVAVEGRTDPIKVQGPDRDPRQKGLNYFVLAHDTEPGARTLLQFLWSRGIEAAGFQYATTRSFQIVALNHGFSKEQFASPAFRQYEQKLEQLGRLWEASHRGAVSFIKQGMYRERYNGRRAITMLTRSEGSQ